MSRSGYSDDLCDDPLDYGRWRGRVLSALRGKRGQAFLKELADEMDAMPEKRLIASELINEEGDCCAIGVVCKSRGVDVACVDVEDYDEVGSLVDIAGPMAAEIEFENDEGSWRNETPEDRWIRMRKWVANQLKAPKEPQRCP